MKKKKLILLLGLAVYASHAVPFFDGDSRVYTFRELVSPYYDPKAQALREEGDEIEFDLNKRLVFSGQSTFELDSCRLKVPVACVNVPSHGFSLYLPRNHDEWTRWEYGENTYVFGGWKHYQFFPKDAEFAVIYAFNTKQFQKRHNLGGVAYPISSYFLDRNANLVGMVRYRLRDSSHTGLNENDVAALYWAVGEGLPVFEF